MLIEQAFFNLPEILVGSGYAKQHYEAGVVSALSLAILQELNGRNASNPISNLVAERRFSDEIERLRVDLHVRLDRLYSGSKDYSEFGFRHSNWIEAKFFRLGKGNPPSTQNLGAVVADIFRLVALVPIEKVNENTNLTITGRYFLHAYRGDPLKHLNPNRKVGGKRKWVGKLFLPGVREIKDFDLTNEKDTFFQHLGHGLKTATCRITVTNFINCPLNPAKDDFYTLVLTRIESGSITFNQRTFTFNADRTFSCNPADEFEQLRADLAKTLKEKPEKGDVDDD